mmetsp:Transcript_25711/g.64780  ORF Transcript_25711/g.64780 Transcript_25711/m.64780 type:complete len:254 (+) Transcript_25711:797-1558(+)
MHQPRKAKLRSNTSLAARKWLAQASRLFKAAPAAEAAAAAAAAEASAFASATAFASAASNAQALASLAAAVEAAERHATTVESMRALSCTRNARSKHKPNCRTQSFAAWACRRFALLAAHSATQARTLTSSKICVASVRPRKATPCACRSRSPAWTRSASFCFWNLPCTHMERQALNTGASANWLLRRAAPAKVVAAMVASRKRARAGEARAWGEFMLMKAACDADFELRPLISSRVFSERVRGECCGEPRGV